MDKFRRIIATIWKEDQYILTLEKPRWLGGFKRPSYDHDKHCILNAKRLY